MSEVIIKDDFLSSEDCDFIINWHKKYWSELLPKFKKAHYNTECIIMNKLLGEPDQTPNIFKKLFSDISCYIKTIDKEAFINYCEIVRWPEQESQKPHKDFYYHPYTSILYLNDDYEGGQTKVGDEIIKPKKGTIVSFKGRDITHEVLKITKGNRYTIPIWYSTLLTYKKDTLLILSNK